MKFLLLVVFFAICAAAAASLLPSKNNTGLAPKLKNATQRSLGKLAASPVAKNNTEVGLDSAGKIANPGKEMRSDRVARHLKFRKHFGKRFG